jgi:hypothetical protein
MMIYVTFQQLPKQKSKTGKVYGPKHDRECAYVLNDFVSALKSSRLSSLTATGEVSDGVRLYGSCKLEGSGVDAMEYVFQVFDNCISSMSL